MKLYRTILGIEFKRLITVMNIILLSLFFVIAMYFTQDGVSKYKGILKEIEEFKTIEGQKIEKYLNYPIYAAIGFRVGFLPPPVSIFFSGSGFATEFYANLNIDERLNLESSLKGKGLTIDRNVGFTDFSGLLILIGSLLCLFYGSKFFESREYLKMLTALNREKRIHYYIIGARFTLIALFFLATIISGILVALLNGIVFLGSDYILLLKFSAAFLLVSFILFIMGLVTATLKSEKYRTVLIMSIWVGVIFFFPIATSKISDVNARFMPSNVHLELENWKKLSSFEKRAIKEHGEYSKEKAQTKEVKALVESFLTKEYKEIQEVERKVELGMKDNSQLYHGISSFTPGTLLLSVTNELSGRGYNSVVDLFKYAENMKNNFLKFYIEKEYSPNKDKVESFIKGDENVYKAISRVPGTYWPGMGLMAVYAFLLTWLSAHRFEKYIFFVSTIPPSQTERKKECVNLERGKYFFYKIKEDRLRDYIYAVFTGKLLPKTKEIMNIPVQIDNEDIISKPGKYSFIFICSADALPHDIRVADFFNLVFNLLDLPIEQTEKLNIEKIKSEVIGNLSKTEKLNLLLSLPSIIKRDVYLFDKDGIGNSMEMYAHLNKKTVELTKQNSIVICLSESSSLSLSESMDCSEFFEQTIPWKRQLESAENIHRSETEEKN